MTKAIWNGVVLAEEANPKHIEGNIYFSPESINRAYLRDSDHTTVCAWKGIANYYHLKVDGRVNENAAWVYSNPHERVGNLRNHMAFWKGVEIAD